MNLESFILPRTSQPVPVMEPMSEPPPADRSAKAESEKQERQVNWTKLLGLAAVLAISAAIWATVALEVSHLWR